MQEQSNPKLGKLPEFLYCTNKEKLPLAPLILYTPSPWIIGRVVYYDNFEEMAHALNREKVIAYTIVPGYNIAIQFAGTLKDNRIPAIGTELFALIERVIMQMCFFFIEEKVKRKPGYYQKFLQIKNQNQNHQT